MDTGTYATQRRMVSMNSTTGRFCVFMTTLANFGAVCMGVIYWNTPAYREIGGATVLVLVATILGTFSLHTLLPICAARAGMGTRMGQGNWKPYLCCYRLTYLLMIPSICCLGLGYGQMISFGEVETLDPAVREQKVIEQRQTGLLGILIGIEDVKAKRVGNFFQVNNGFVALNLTKSVVKTLGAYDRVAKDGKKLQPSKYQEVEYFEPEEESQQIAPLPPDTRMQFVVAPVFRRWQSCLTRFRTTSRCIEENPIVAWAVVATETPCSDLGSVSCQIERPVLDPIYNCQQEMDHNLKDSKVRYGQTTMGYIGQLCGRVAAPAPLLVREEFFSLYERDGWKDASKTTLWIDVTPDGCIADYKGCKARWELLGFVGVLLGAFVGGFMVFSIWADCYVDLKLREAKVYTTAIADKGSRENTETLRRYGLA